MGLNNKTNSIISISAIITSFITMLALVYQSNLVRVQNKLIQKEQYASVMPYLVMSFGKETNEDFGLSLKNEGLGPAFIDQIMIIYKDTARNERIIEFYLDVLKPEIPEHVNLTYSDVSEKSIIPAGERIGLLSLSTSQYEALELLNEFATQEAVIQIKYSSIYGQKWTMRNMEEIHVPLEE